ncbi:hypothetical protein [Rubripirellula obstinata]|uniref:hypothetical protein n=1 Tax=Rubripirellula obstinata TaxID=406547 RepID=UPI001F25D766|nr:hypothetical protein [Rubripirellula obstinata]
MPRRYVNCYFFGMSYLPKHETMAGRAIVNLCIRSSAIAFAGVLAVLVSTQSASAQITPGRTLSASRDPLATLEEQLVNRLRATALDQRAYLKFVVKQVREGKLDIKLVVGIERYAIRRNPSLPFLYFERALRFEAGKRGVALPPVRQFATSVAPTFIPR